MGLPLRHGGLGLVAPMQALAEAGYLAAAALTHTAMSTGAARFRPFAGASVAHLQLLWDGLRGCDALQVLFRDTRQLSSLAQLNWRQ